jgi:nitroreductase
MGVQSVAAAVQNLLLAAYAEGLGTCWFCAPLFCQQSVKEILKLPKEFEPQALITVGYPAEKPKAPKRKPLKSIARKNYWKGRK